MIHTTQKQADTTLNALVQKWLLLCENRGLSPHTLNIYRKAMDYLLNENKGKKTRDITSIEINNLIGTLKSKGLSTSSISTYMGVYRTFCKWGTKQGHFSISTDFIESIKRQDTDIVVLTSTDIKNMLNACNIDTLEGSRNKAIVSFIATSGLRVSELCSIDIDDLPKETIGKGSVGKIAIKGKGKKSKSNVVYLTRATQNLINEYLKARTDDHPALFVSNRTKYGEWKRIHRHTVFLIIRGLGEKVGIPRPISPHTLRHYTATAYLRENKNIKAVSSILRHSNTRITEQYLHYVDAELEDIVADVMD